MIVILGPLKNLLCAGSFTVASSSPVLVSDPGKVLSQLVGPGISYNIGGIWGQVKAGQIWNAAEGKRLVVYVDSSVVYMLDSKVYIQDAAGFANDVRTYALGVAGKAGEKVVQIGYAELKFAMGLAAGASGVAFALVIGTEVVEFIHENHENFGKWQKQLLAVLKARAALKQIAPVLYDKVFSSVLKQVCKDVKGSILDGVSLEIVTFGIGVIVGTLGKKAAAGKFSMFAVLFIVLEQLVIRVSTGVIPNAIKITEENYRKMADQILLRLSTTGVHLTERDVRRIYEEVQRHPAEVRKIFQEMKEAFDKQ